jgi:predicted nucleic acid-binding protein
MACADEGDPVHRRACEARDAALEQGNLLVTTDYVVDETLTFIRMRLGLAAAKAWWEQLEGSTTRPAVDAGRALRTGTSTMVFRRAAPCPARCP